MKLKLSHSYSGSGGNRRRLTKLTLIAWAAAVLGLQTLHAQSVPGTWTLTFSDEFDGTSLNTNIWSPYLRWGAIINGERQFYEVPNVQLINQKLRFTSEKRDVLHQYDADGDGTVEPGEGYTQNYASGAVSTHGKWAQTYGLFEARMKLPPGPGLWPAFWLMPDRGASVPDYGNPGRWDVGQGGMEYDIMEYIGGWGNFFHTANHWSYTAPYGGRGAGGKNYPSHTVSNPTAEFHTYSMYWGPGISIFYVDGVEVDRYEGTLNGSLPHYMILNCAMGGGWPNSDGSFLDDGQLPAYTEVDWVRVYSGTPLGIGFTSLQGRDVKAKNWVGSNTESNGVHSIQAGGAGVGGIDDEFRFVCKRMVGNVSITARVTDMTLTEWWVGAGVMIRDNLDANSTSAWAFSALGNKQGICYRLPSYRLSNPPLPATTLTADASTIRWYRLTRTGNVFTFEHSADGVAWQPMTGSPQTIEMDSEVFVGLAVTAHSPTLMTTATLDNVNITGTTAGTGNLALNRPAFSSPIEGNLEAAKAVDGTMGTRWGSEFANNQWVYVDLGSTYNINRVKLDWEVAYASAYNVQLSHNASTWSNIYTTTTGNGGVDDLTGLSGTGRYLRILCNQRATQWGNSIWELQAFGNPVPTLFGSFSSLAAEDGYIQESSETSNVGGTVNATANSTSALSAGDLAGDLQRKMILSFDTSSLPDNATILSVKLRLRRGTVAGTTPFNTHGTATVDIKGGSGFGNDPALAAGDFQAAADGAQVAVLSAAANDGSYSEGYLNAAGLNALNKSGKTQFRVAFTLDDNDDNGDDYIGYYAGEAASYDRPVLEVVYY